MLNMSNKDVAQVFRNGHPVNKEELINKKYLGIDLSLPPLMNKILWKTFRKTFYREPETGIIRGWNVRLEQTGWEQQTIAMKNKKGEQIAFGHYHLLHAKGKKFPKGWQGADYLDYGVAGNAPYDLARLGYCPLVAVNEGSSELLLGWEVFKIGNIFIPLNDYWLLKMDGDLDIIHYPAKGLQ